MGEDVKRVSSCVRKQQPRVVRSDVSPVSTDFKGVPSWVAAHSPKETCPYWPTEGAILETHYEKEFLKFNDGSPDGLHVYHIHCLRR